MTIHGVSSGVSPALQGAGGKFFLPGASEFAYKLAIGQIIKGKVLRQFDGSRYLVNFDGHERVVDSAIPMKTGELLHGRVIGIGERIEMQRILHGEPDINTSLPETATRSGAQPTALQNMLTRYQVELGNTDQAALTRAMRGASDSQAMAMAGILLNRLGLPQSQELLNALYGTLMSRRVSGVEHSAIDIQPLLDAVAAIGVPNAGITTPLGDAVRQVLEQANSARTERDGRNAESPDKAMHQVASAAPDTSQADAEPDAGGRDFTRQLGHYLLNVQTEGSVAHRAGTIPLLLGDRLVEVDVALFEQRRNAEQTTDARHRHLVFRLNTETLGPVEISARLAGDRVRVRISASDEIGTAKLATHVEALRSALSEAGWSIDEIAYETRSDGERNSVAHAVVEHVISQGSLNHLV